MLRKSFIARAILIVLLVSPMAAYADSYNGTVTITCVDAFDFGPSVITLNRDNTGTGSDAFQIVAKDGIGTTLRSFNNTLTLGDYVFGDLVFTTPPVLNPITVTFTSLAGNGLPAQQVFSNTGVCASLGVAGSHSVPTLSEWGVIALSSLLAMGAVFTLRRRRQRGF